MNEFTFTFTTQEYETTLKGIIEDIIDQILDAPEEFEDDLIQEIKRTSLDGWVDLAVNDRVKPTVDAVASWLTAEDYDPYLNFFLIPLTIQVLFSTQREAHF